jgi:hypothetical protein
MHQMKTLNQFLESYRPRPEGERNFVDKHTVEKHSDANGNKDDVFKAKKVKPVKRAETRHGYEVGDDVKAYES